MKSARGGLRRIPFAALLFVLTATTASAQGQMSSSRPLSSTVIGTYVADDGELTLLVLWRGTPGWFSRGGGNSSGGGGGSRPSGKYGSVWFTYGGVGFSVEFNYTAGTARLLDQDISLVETNVVLVDDVDGASGARIVGRQRVNPKLPDRVDPDPTLSAADRSLMMMRSDPLLAVIRRAPALAEYLQCDLPMPMPEGFDSAVPDPAARARIGEYMQETIAAICRQATAR